ncbi:MAG: hypothetical protein ACLFVZ_08365 [Actinomycetota bacterium]
MQAHLDPAEKTGRSNRVSSYVGFLAYLATGLIFVVGGVYLVPGLWLVPIWGGWLVGLWVAYRLMSRGSPWVLAMAPAALIVLWAYVTAGWSLWGWVVEDLPLGVR